MPRRRDAKLTQSGIADGRRTPKSFRMKQQQRFIIALVASAAVLILWNYVFPPVKPPQPNANANQQTAQASPQSSAQNSPQANAQPSASATATPATARAAASPTP